MQSGKQYEKHCEKNQGLNKSPFHLKKCHFEVKHLIPPLNVATIRQGISLSRCSVPTDVVVDSLGSITTDAEIFLPESEMDGTTIFVLPHRGVINCAKAVCIEKAEIVSAADTGTV